jgi:hypothetical protein
VAWAFLPAVSAFVPKLARSPIGGRLQLRYARKNAGAAAWKGHATKDIPACSCDGGNPVGIWRSTLRPYLSNLLRISLRELAKDPCRIARTERFHFFQRRRVPVNVGSRSGIRAVASNSF